LPSDPPDARALERFFHRLRGDVLSAWVSKAGLSYDRVLYGVAYPYQKGDVVRVLGWARCRNEHARLPPLAALNKELASYPYPHLASRAPRGVSGLAWSCILHFCDPSYPVLTAKARAGLRNLGFKLGKTRTAAEYARYLEAVDLLKELAPVWAVPETNWYLARILEVGLEAWDESATVRG
jgi:hypothetical protein